MKVFVTGGTGFVGQHIVGKLIGRGYEVFGLAYNERSAAVLAEMGAKVVSGDILDSDTMRDGMAGSNIVIHIAGNSERGGHLSPRNEAVNVGGTRNVLRMANELGVPKIVYSSTVNVFGDTKGQYVDETFFHGGPFVTDNDRTKWIAYYKVALPLIEDGAPIITVLPGYIYGPGDPGMIGQLMSSFYRGRILALPGSNLTVTYAHVEDIAEGHILAAERGKPGESYILAGPAVPLGEMVDFWGQLTGRRSFIVRIPTQILKPFAPVLGAVDSFVSLPQFLNEEDLRILDATYMARADKARDQLGWETRSLQEGMIETFRWIAGSIPSAPKKLESERKIAGLALLTASLLLIMWLIGRKRE